MLKKEEAEMRNEEYVNVNNDKESIDCIEDRNISAASLVRNIDRMLTDIDNVMEKSRIKWSILL
jgi:hypothetical protein